MPHKPEGEIYNCGHHALCQVPSSIMYAWAKDAPPTSLPPDVGFQLDEEDDGYVVMQVRILLSIKVFGPLPLCVCTHFTQPVSDVRPKNWQID